ncbi:MAG TPA: DUF5667 domain-containing protein [Candidatus Dormibacteraeota bacterium]|nr:DUF5667 domain-containing protein [Candidatus Dormibacteraeota bacterium]
MTPEVQRLERLAERLRAVDPATPSPGAKIRGWNLVLTAVEQSATVRSRAHPVRRLLLAAVAAAVLLLAGVIAASADSLPDSTLYPLKGVVENVRGALAFSPADKVRYDLDIARTRVIEAAAMIARHRLDLADRALSSLDDQLNDAALVVQAEKQSDPALAASLENRLVQAIASNDQQLAGLQGQATNPATVTAITRARDRAQGALQTADQPASSSAAGKSSASPAATGTGSGSGNGQGNGASASPHATGNN